MFKLWANTENSRLSIFQDVQHFYAFDFEVKYECWKGLQIVTQNRKDEDLLL